MKRTQQIFLVGVLSLGLSSALAQTDGEWVPIGPAPIESPSGNNNTIIGNNNPVSGAVNAVAAHPTNANIVYIGATNGGIWKTTNATAAVPQWTQQTDGQLSSSVGDVAFDPTDPSGQTLVAGFGRFSSLSFDGGARAGMLRTTNGGNTWTSLGTEMVGRNIAKVAARGNVLLAAVNAADSNTCGQGGDFGVFRSIDTGATWNQVTNGLFGSAVTALAEDPTNPQVFYASIIDLSVCGNDQGIFRSDDTGGTWTNVTSQDMNGLIDSNSVFEISVGNGGAVFVAIITGGEVMGVFRSPTGTGNWVEMDLPGTTEQRSGGMPDMFWGVHPGKQGVFHASLVADPTNDNIVYIGGDRQPFGPDETTGFGPNSIGACSFGGRLFRGDISLSVGSQWEPITHNFADADGTPPVDCPNPTGTAPHADSRDMAFDANGNLLEGDDGGIYRRLSPRNPRGIWVDVNGSLQTTEQHSGRFDRLSAVAVSGNQDNGSSEQSSFNSPVWSSISGGDGGDVAIDYLAITDNSVRYTSFQNFDGPIRRQFNANGVLQGGSQLALNTLGGVAFEGQFVTPIEVNQVVGNRLVIGGGNAVFESLDRGDTITEVPPVGLVAAGSGRRSIAYGGSNAVDFLLVAATDGGLYRRLPGAGQLTQVYASSDGRLLRAVLIDAADPNQVFVLEDSQVVRSTSGGDPGSFSAITGNLINLFSPGVLRTMTFMQTPDGDVLAVGADRGIYFATANGGFTDWTQAGTGLPTSPVFDLNYDFSANRLVAFTLGRGTFVLPLSGTIDPGATVCSAPNAAIPDASSIGVTDTLSVPTSGSLTGLTASVQVSHTFTGDLVFSLRREADGATITLMDRPGLPDLGANGCNLPNVDTLFDDSSSTPVENVCVPGGTAISGTLRPQQPLSTFNGGSAAGTWALTVSDNAAQDVGTLVRWCLTPTVSGGGPLIFEDSFETQ